MSEIDYRKYEVVGFNGVVSLPFQCARALPIGHIKGTDNYFIANQRFHEHGAIHHSVALSFLQEIKDYEKEGRLTLLNFPLPMVRDATVTYVTKERLNSKGLNPLIKPILIMGGQNIVWQNLPKKGVWVACSSNKTIEKLLDILKR